MAWLLRVLWSSQIQKQISSYVRVGVDALKRIYSSLKSEMVEEIRNFNILYEELSRLSKTKVSSIEEAQELTNNIVNTLQRIDLLENNIQNNQSKKY